MKLIKAFALLAAMVLLPDAICAQELKVVSFEESTTDLKARTEPRVDLNNDPCALLRVEIPTLENLKFSGGLGVVGSVEHNPGEYLVYLPNGTKKIVINHPDFLPCTVSFQEYGIRSLSGKTTYKLVLGLPKNTGFTTIVRFRTNVQVASLEINGQTLTTSNAEFDVPLPKGDYEYTVSTSIAGFSPYSGKVSISGDDVVTEIPKVNLATDKSYTLTVYSDKEASISIDGEPQNKNGVFSVSLPAGLHTIEANAGSGGRWYLKRDKDLSAANDSIDMRLRGRLVIESPRNATFTIVPSGESIKPDKSKFKSGEAIKLLGKYTVTAKKKGYELTTSEISIGARNDLSHYYIPMISEADMLYNGLNGRKVNKKKAQNLYASMIQSGDDQAMLSYGNILIKEDEWLLGYDLIKKAAGLGNVAAMQMAYESARSDTDRETYSEMAAMRGNVNAMKFYADMKLAAYKARHSRQDSENALKWYMAAYESGDNSVLCRIGDFYHNGWAIEQDYRKAYGYYSEAYAEKDVEAEKRIGYYYLKGLGGLPKDYDKAMSIYSTLIRNKQADDEVYYYAAYIRYKGNSIYTAADYLQQIRRSDVILNGKEFQSENFRELGKYYFTSNPSYSMSFYKMALKMGNTSSENYLNIGKLYYLGRGTTKDVSQAINYFGKAVEDNPGEALYYIGLCFYSQKSFTTAFNYFIKSANEEYSSAYGQIGTMYYNGQGVPKDNAKAVECWEYAADKGHQASIKNLIKYYEYKRNYEAVERWKEKLK